MREEENDVVAMRCDSFYLWIIAIIFFIPYMITESGDMCRASMKELERRRNERTAKKEHP